MARLFTCKFYPSGMSDQIYQLQWVYNLGRQLGLQYVHRPALSRWSTLEYSKFLGLGIDELRFEDFSPLGVCAADSTAAARALTSGDRASFLSKYANDNRILEFSHPGRTKWRKTSPPRLKTVYSLPWRERFWLANADAPSPFSDGGTAVAVHIRRGDRVWVKDGSRYVMPYVGRVRREHELNDNSGMSNNMRRAPSMSQYEKAIRALIERLGVDNVEVRVYSDGFLEYSAVRVLGKMATSALVLALKLQLRESFDLLWAMPRIKRYLREIRGERDKLEQLTGLGNVTTIVGREDDQTIDAVYAFAHADICMGAKRGIFPHFKLHRKEQHYIRVMHANENWIARIDHLYPATATDAATQRPTEIPVA